MLSEGNLNRIPADAVPESAYPPSPGTIYGLARAFNLPKGYTFQDVARAWRDSRQLAKESYGEESGNPEDLLGLDEDAGAMDQWAEDVLNAAANDNR